MVIIYQANWGFDSRYGKFPGANATSITALIDTNGVPVTSIPPVLDSSASEPQFAALNAAKAPVVPFDIGAFVRRRA